MVAGEVQISRKDDGQGLKFGAAGKEFWNSARVLPEFDPVDSESVHAEDGVGKEAEQWTGIAEMQDAQFRGVKAAYFIFVENVAVVLDGERLEMDHV